MKLTRRQLAGIAGKTALGTAVAASALAQAPAPAVPPDPDQAARDSNKRISDTLSKYEIPIATEPAFQFKA